MSDSWEEDTALIGFLSCLISFLRYAASVSPNILQDFTEFKVDIIFVLGFLEYPLSCSGLGRTERNAVCFIKSVPHE